MRGYVNVIEFLDAHIGVYLGGIYFGIVKHGLIVTGVCSLKRLASFNIQKSTPLLNDHHSDNNNLYQHDRL